MTGDAGGGPTFGLDARPPGRGVHRFSHEAMATVFEVRCAHEDARYAAQAGQEAFDLVDRGHFKRSETLIPQDENPAVPRPSLDG